jgi:hypothetical protein
MAAARAVRRAGRGDGQLRAARFDDAAQLAAAIARILGPLRALTPARRKRGQRVDLRVCVNTADAGRALDATPPLGHAAVGPHVRDGGLCAPVRSCGLGRRLRQPVRRRRVRLGRRVGAGVARAARAHAPAVPLPLPPKLTAEMAYRPPAPVADPSTTPVDALTHDMHLSAFFADNPGARETIYKAPPPAYD